MSDSHTPGPWEVGVEGNGTPGYVYCDNSLGSAVAIVYGPALNFSVFPRTEEIANAHLIAAAPDLLATAKRVSDLCGQIYVRLSNVESAALRQAFDQLDAAIAKATRIKD